MFFFVLVNDSPDHLVGVSYYKNISAGFRECFGNVSIFAEPSNEKNMNIRLSKYEKQAFRAIKITCPPKSLMGIAVDNVVKAPTSENIRSLLISIFTQGKDNPPMMVNMLGFFDLPSFIAHHCKADKKLQAVYSQFLYNA